MGFTVKFNWVLQIDVPEPLTEKRSYSYKKTGNRVFPLDTPIDLIDMNRNAIAKIRILSFNNEASCTQGRFEVLKLYTGEEKSVLTNYWIENQ